MSKSRQHARMCVRWSVVAPGGQQRGHAHAGSEQAYIILSGKARMQVGEERQVVSAGALIFVPPSTRHSISNAGSDDLVYLTAASPPFAVEHFFAESGAVEMRPEAEEEAEATPL